MKKNVKKSNRIWTVKVLQQMKSLEFCLTIESFMKKIQKNLLLMGQWFNRKNWLKTVISKNFFGEISSFRYFCSKTQKKDYTNWFFPQLVDWQNCCYLRRKPSQNWQLEKKINLQVGSIQNFI